MDSIIPYTFHFCMQSLSRSISNAEYFGIVAWYYNVQKDPLYKPSPICEWLHGVS